MASDQRLHNIFFIWVCIRRHWIARPHPSSLSTQEWKNLLSGEYFRQLAPDKASFDITMFWVHGWGHLFPLCDDDDPVPLFRGERLTPPVFADKHIKNILVYDVSLLSMKFQFEQADDVLVGKPRHPSPERDSLFKVDASAIDFSRSANPYAISWMTLFEQFILHWPQWKEKPPRFPLLCDVAGDTMDDSRIAANLRIFYQGIQDSLRTVPTMFYPRPDVPRHVIDACAYL